jgi:hypothetical protein
MIRRDQSWSRRFAEKRSWASFRLFVEHTISGQANSAAIERPARHNAFVAMAARGLMPGAGFLALRVPVDVAEEFGKRVHA